MSTGCRRGKAMPTDSPAAKFLYTIIKQLDLKSVDWSLVATQLEISNGHAARMRYSRFRQQMEGTTAVPRAPRQKKNANKGEKGLKADLKKDSAQSMVKQENGPFVKQEQGMLVKQEPVMYVKPDPGAMGLARSPIKDDPYMQRSLSLADIPHGSQGMMPTQSGHQMMASYPPMTVAPVDLTMQSPLPAFSSAPTMDYGCPSNHHHVWAPVKMEQNDGANHGDILVKMEMPEDHSGSGPVYWGSTRMD